MSKHTVQEDFEHFLTHTGYGKLPEEEIARLRQAYYYGADVVGIIEDKTNGETN